jgi:hypothetical protein
MERIELNLRPTNPLQRYYETLGFSLAVDPESPPTEPVLMAIDL